LFIYPSGLWQYKEEAAGNLRRITSMLDKTKADPAPISSQGGDALALDALPDGQLLERFVQQREEAAFAVLVRRHGPMVLSVCRRLLRRIHDAEDAFQATFLVLTKKAHRLRRPGLLANWLYGVAYRNALHARQRSGRRREREREAATMSASNRNSDLRPQELRGILDEELHRLPEKYRAPLVLCYLEGKTNEEAARLLGWPIGSISYRLARARDMLRERLEPRLAGLTVLLPAVLLSDCFQPAIVPPVLAWTTVQASVALAGAKIASIGSGIISASVREIVEASGRSPTPSWGRWLLTAFLIALILLGLGSAAIALIGPETFLCS
jgi:RNA polymerase sigma factor (sigma-70 family)